MIKVMSELLSLFNPSIPSSLLLVVGVQEGVFVGPKGTLGAALGLLVGAVVGADDGSTVGLLVGTAVGTTVGTDVGAEVGMLDGEKVGPDGLLDGT
jgi:hypothetical protein